MDTNDHCQDLGEASVARRGSPARSVPGPCLARAWPGSGDAGAALCKMDAGMDRVRRGIGPLESALIAVARVPVRWTRASIGSRRGGSVRWIRALIARADGTLAMDSGIHRASGSTRVRWIRGSIRQIGYEFGDPSQGWWPGGAPAPGERPMAAPRPRRRGAALAAVVSEVDSGVDALLRRRRPGGFGDRPPETWVDSAIHLRRPAPSARNRPSARQAGSLILGAGRDRGVWPLVGAVAVPCSSPGA